MQLVSLLAVVQLVSVLAVLQLVSVLAFVAVGELAGIVAVGELADVVAVGGGTSPDRYPGSCGDCSCSKSWSCGMLLATSVAGLLC